MYITAIRWPSVDWKMASLSSCRLCGGQVSTEAQACPHCGQPDPCEQWRDVRAALNRGNKIEAIKIVIEKTGWDLSQAKEFVESLR